MIIKVSEINQLLIKSRNESVYLNEKLGGKVFKFLLNTYLILEEKDRDKGRKLSESYTIKLNSGEKRILIHKANYRRNGNTSHEYCIINAN